MNLAGFCDFKYLNALTKVPQVYLDQYCQRYQQVHKVIQNFLLVDSLKLHEIYSPLVRMY